MRDQSLTFVLPGLAVGVPAQYERLVTTTTVREQLQRVAGSGSSAHTTVLYTMDGAVYHKRCRPVLNAHIVSSTRRAGTDPCALSTSL